jgi:hypothetical protein
MSPAVLQPRYERLGDFRKLIAHHDPGDRFSNEFIDRNVHGR